MGRPNQTLPSAKAQRCDANERQIGFAHPSSHLSVYQKPIGRPIGLPLADCITVRQVAQPLIGLPMADWALDWLQSAHRRPTSYYFCNFLKSYIIFLILYKNVLFKKNSKKQQHPAIYLGWNQRFPAKRK